MRDKLHILSHTKPKWILSNVKWWNRGKMCATAAASVAIAGAADAAKCGRTHTHTHTEGIAEVIVYSLEPISVT